MLEKLNDEQTRLMYEHRDNYKDFIVNNGAHVPQRLKVEDIKDDIEWLYKKAGLEPPKHILIANSYLNEKLMINYVKRYGIPKIDQVRKLIYEIIFPMYMKVFHSTNGCNDQRFIDYMKPLKDIAEDNANNIKRNAEKKVTDPDNTRELIKKFKEEFWYAVEKTYHERTNFASNEDDDRPLQQQIIDMQNLSYNIASTNKDKVSELDGRDITYHIIGQIKRQLWTCVEKTLKESSNLTYDILSLIDHATDMNVLGGTIESITKNKIDKSLEEMRSNLLKQEIENTSSSIRNMAIGALMTDIMLLSFDGGDIKKTTETNLLSGDIKDNDDHQVGEKIIGDFVDNIWSDMFDRIYEKVSRKIVIGVKGEYVVDGPINDSDNISINKTTHDKLNNTSSSLAHESIDSFITSLTHVMIDVLRYLVSPEIRYRVNEKLLGRPDIDDMDVNIGERLEVSTEKQLSSEDMEDPIKKALARTILEMKAIIDKENLETLYKVSSQTSAFFQNLVFRSIIGVLKLATIRALDKQNDEKLEFVEQGFGLSWNSWLSFYYFFVKIGIIKNEDFERYYHFMKKGIWSIQFFKDWCICTQMPLKIHRDTNNRLHSIDGSAIEWRDNDNNDDDDDGILVSQQEQEQGQQLTKEEMVNNSVRDIEIQNLIINYVYNLYKSFNEIYSQLPDKSDFFNSLSEYHVPHIIAMDIQKKTSEDVKVYKQMYEFIHNQLWKYIDQYYDQVPKVPSFTKGINFPASAMHIETKTKKDITDDEAYKLIKEFVMNLVSSLNKIFASGILPHTPGTATDGIMRLDTNGLIIRNKTGNEIKDSSLNSKKKRTKDYFIHGVAFDEELWEKVVSDKLTIKEVLGITNMEQRNIILTMIPPSRIVKELNAKLISTHTQKKKGRSFLRKNYDDLEHKEIKLYNINSNELGFSNNIPIYILFYTDPSTNREYFSYIRPDKAIDAATAMASKFGLSKKEYLHNLEVES